MHTRTRAHTHTHTHTRAKLTEGWSLIRIFFHQSGLSSGCSHQDGLLRVVSSVWSSEWSLIRIVFHQSGLSSGTGWSHQYDHQNGLSSGLSFIRMVFHLGVLTRGISSIQSSEWSLIRIDFYESVIYLGFLIRLVSQGGLKVWSPQQSLIREVFD